MLAAVFAMDSIVAKYMVSVGIDIRVVALFSRFLYQPCTNILLAHVINQVFEFREIRRLVDKDIAVGVSWTTPEALGILGIDGGDIVFLFLLLLLLLTNSWGCRVVRSPSSLARLVSQPRELSMGVDGEKDGVAGCLSRWLW